jgi:hypothetical protein
MITTGFFYSNFLEVSRNSAFAHFYNEVTQHPAFGVYTEDFLHRVMGNDKRMPLPKMPIQRFFSQSYGQTRE